MSIKNLSLICAPFHLHTKADECAWRQRLGIANLFLYESAGPDIRLAGNDQDIHDILDRVWMRAAAS